jgi:hypothetical protein
LAVKNDEFLKNSALLENKLKKYSEKPSCYIYYFLNKYTPAVFGIISAIKLLSRCGGVGFA